MSIETQQSICQWGHETFGASSIDVLFERYMDEVQELSGLINTRQYDRSRKEIGDEMADTLIVLYQVAQYLKIDLLYEVDKKMYINRKRKWKLHGDGTGQHIEEK